MVCMLCLMYVYAYMHDFTPWQVLKSKLHEVRECVCVYTCVYVCLSVCVCIYIYIYTCVHAHTHKYMYMYIHTY